MSGKDVCGFHTQDLHHYRWDQQGQSCHHPQIKIVVLVYLKLNLDVSIYLMQGGIAWTLRLFMLLHYMRIYGVWLNGTKGSLEINLTSPLLLLIQVSSRSLGYRKNLRGDGK